MLHITKPPTNKRYLQTVRKMPDAILLDYTSMMNDNEKAQKQILKYRAQFWAKNIVDEAMVSLNVQ